MKMTSQLNQNNMILHALKYCGEIQMHAFIAITM